MELMVYIRLILIHQVVALKQDGRGFKGFSIKKSQILYIFLGFQRHIQCCVDIWRHSFLKKAQTKFFCSSHELPFTFPRNQGGKQFCRLATSFPECVTTIFTYPFLEAAWVALIQAAKDNDQARYLFVGKWEYYEIMSTMSLTTLQHSVMVRGFQLNFYNAKVLYRSRSADFYMQ